MTWIKCGGDHMPREGLVVLVSSEGALNSTCAYIDNELWVNAFNEIPMKQVVVTHWQHFPEPPK